MMLFVYKPQSYGMSLVIWDHTAGTCHQTQNQEARYHFESLNAFCICSSSPECQHLYAHTMQS